jgi:hypothetical protein
MKFSSILFLMSVNCIAPATIDVTPLDGDAGVDGLLSDSGPKGQSIEGPLAIDLGSAKPYAANLAAITLYSGSGSAFPTSDFSAWSFNNQQLQNETGYHACRGTSTTPAPLATADSIFVFDASGCGPRINPRDPAVQFRVTSANNGAFGQPPNAGGIPVHLQWFQARGDGTMPERGRIDQWGHLAFAAEITAYNAACTSNGSAYGYCTMVSNCGTNPQIPPGWDSSGDSTGGVLVGSNDTGCIIEFSAPWSMEQHPSFPVCLLEVENNTGIILNEHQTVNGITINDGSGALAGHVVKWHCFGTSGGLN